RAAAAALRAQGRARLRLAAPRDLPVLAGHRDAVLHGRDARPRRSRQHGGARGQARVERRGLSSVQGAARRRRSARDLPLVLALPRDVLMTAHSLDILIPTIDRLESLIATLTSVAMQDVESPRIVVADQSGRAAASSPVVRTLHRIIEARGGDVEWHYRPPSTGIAEQRDFLLARA